MSTVVPIRAPRQDNRRRQVTDAAAALFCRRGFHATPMRDIAGAAGMLPGSLYYHFPSKGALLLAVYEEGVQRIATHVDERVARHRDPFARLEAACIAHLEILLDRSPYAQVVIRVLPGDTPDTEVRLRELRDDYESRFRTLIDALDLPADLDRGHLRRLVLGALNWSQHWYRPGGDSPRTVARQLLKLLAPIAGGGHA